VTFYGTLYPYQTADVELMQSAMRVLLCYEMGLGKTVMSIACIEQLHDDGQVDAGLVIAQSDLKYQWAEKIEEFTKGSAASIVIDGTPAQRAGQYDLAKTGEYRYVIVNYEQVVNDWDRVRRLPRDFLIGDEITAIKGFRAKRSKRVKRLTAPYVYGLTGDPMENGKLEELYSIMQWIDDRVLGRYDLFDKTFIVRNPFGGVSRYRNVEAFRRQMEGHWSRRTQDEPDVAPYLPKVMPPKNHYATLDFPAKQLYKRVAKELLADLTEAAGKMGGSFDVFSHYGGGQLTPEQNRLRGQIMSKTQALQMLCDHPELLRHSARLYRQTEASGGSGGSAYAAELDGQGLLEPLRRTPKQDVVMRLTEEILDDSHSKVVLFSHDVPTLDYLESALQGRGFQASQYHGGMNAKKKEASKKRFQNEADVRVLLSSDAGGYGVDLPQGNHIINYDLPWSSGALKQRNSRIIRASSEFKRVYLHNVLVKDSVDEWQHDKVAGKLAVGNAFLDGRGLDEKGGLRLDLESLTKFLRTRSP